MAKPTRKSARSDAGDAAANAQSGTDDLEVASRSDGAWAHRLLAPLSLFVLVTLLYMPSLSNDFIYDDHTLLLLERRPQDLGDVMRVLGERHWPSLPYYRPIPRLTMVVQKWLHGDYAPPYHAFNVLLMGLLATTAYWTFRTRSLRMVAVPAWLAALVVGVHPVASSCVYPICSGRETMWPALFMLLGIGAWLREGRANYVLALTALAGALLSKEQAIVLPAVFVVADCMKLAPSATRSWTRWARRYAPVIAIVGVYWGIRMVLFQSGAEYQLRLFEQPILFGFSWLYGLQTVVAPFSALVYEPLPDDWLSGWRILIAIMVVLAIAVLVFHGKAGARNVAWFWLAWIVLVSLPTANILKQEALFDERYQLLAVVGAVGIVGTLASQNWNRRRVRWIAVSAAVAAIVACGVISQRRVVYFADDFAFLAQWRIASPAFDYAGTHWQLARFRLSKGHLELAESHAREALTALPAGDRARVTLAHTLLEQGRLNEAELEFRAVLSRNDARAEGLAGLAQLAEARGDWQQAASHYQVALGQQPIVDEIARRYAWLLATCEEQSVRDGAKAVRWATVAIDALPDAGDAPASFLSTLRAVALDTLAAAEAENGSFAKAIRREREAIELAPAEMQVALRKRLALYQSGQPYRELPP